MKFQKILIIYNPTAGWRRRKKLNGFVNLLRSSGCSVSVLETTARGDAEQFAMNCAEMKIDCVVAAGGDGTINEIMNGLACHDINKQIPLAILPLGTANVFAFEIGLNLSIKKCADVVRSGCLKKVHLGTVDNRLFIQMAGVGFDAQVVSDVSPPLKRRFGKLAYVWKTLVGFFRYRLPTYTVSIDGIIHGAASVVVANGHFYGGKFVCAPQASVFEDDLKVCIFKSQGGWNAFRYALGLVRGRLPYYPDVEVISGKYLEIDGDINQPAQADGDIVANLPLSIEAGSATIKVLLPA